MANWWFRLKMRWLNDELAYQPHCLSCGREVPRGADICGRSECEAWLEDRENDPI